MEAQEFTAELLSLKDKFETKQTTYEDSFKLIELMKVGVVNDWLGEKGDEVENSLVNYLLEKFDTQYDTSKVYLLTYFSYLLSTLTPDKDLGILKAIVGEVAEVIKIVCNRFSQSYKMPLLEKLIVKASSCGVGVIVN